MNWYVGKIRNSRLVYGVNFLVFFVLSILLIVCLQSLATFKDVVFAFWLADIAIILLLILLVFANSYRIKGNKLIVFDSFKRRIVEIDQVPMLILTNNINVGQGYYVERVKNKHGQKVPCPIVSIIDEDVDLEGINLDYPMKNWDIMPLIKQKSDSAEYLYGFLVNKKVVEVFQKYFSGKLYIARTVFENFKDEITEINSISNYADRKIGIIEDCNAKGDWCNSPYL